MKTNPFARKVRKFRIAIVCLSIAVLAGVEFTVGQSVAMRFGQVAAPQTEGPQPPNVDLGVVMGALR